MLIQYKDWQASLIYCAKTKTYYGEVLELENGLVFQATNRQHAIEIMHWLVDEHLAKLDLTP